MLTFTPGNELVYPSEPTKKFPWIYPQSEAWAMIAFLITALGLGLHAFVVYLRQVLALDGRR